MSTLPVEKPQVETGAAAGRARLSLAQTDAGAPPRKPKKRRAWIYGLLATAAIAVVVVLVVRNASSRADEPADTASRFAVVHRGEFVETRRIQGTVEAVDFRPIAAPRLSGPGLGSLIVTRLVASGKTVKKGELLVEFDRQAQIKIALDRQAEFVDFSEQIKKKQADQAVARAADQTALTQAENAMKSAELELRRNEIISEIDLKRKAAAAELRSLEIQRDRSRNAMEYAQNNSKRLEIHSPIDGIVVLNTIWKGGQMGEVQEGDEVRPGVPFMQVVNRGVMQVRGRVNQADIALLAAGQKVRIGLDAYPELSFGGKLDRIAAIGVTSSLSQKVRTFQVLFSVDGTDAKLMPDLSAYVDVELQRSPGKLLVPRDALVRDGADYYVMAGSGSQFERKKVKVAAISDTEAVVESGIEEGSRVMRSPSQP